MVFITLISPIGVLYAIASSLTVSSFNPLEQQDVRKSVERVERSLTEGSKYLESMSGDWANWDDTYNYMKDGNPAFISSNIDEGTFTNLQLNFILFLRPSGQLAFGQGFDLKKKKFAPIPTSLLQELSSKRLLNKRDPASAANASGILLLPEGSLVLVSQPILNSKKQGPSRGTQIFAYFLNPKTFEHASKFGRVSVQLQPLTNQQLSPDFQRAYAAILKDNTIPVEALSDDVVAGYTLLRDVYGNPALILRVEVSRDIYKQGQANLRYLLISLSVVATVFGIMFVSVTQVLLKKLAKYLNELKGSQLELFQSKELAEVTLQSIGDAVIATNAKGEIESLNAVAEKLTGWRIQEAKGLQIERVFQIFNEDTRAPESNLLEAILQEGQVVNTANHLILLHRDGSEFAIDKSTAPIRSKDGKIVGAVLVFRDVTQERLMARRLLWEAGHDNLTQLINRREFEIQLERALGLAKSHQQQHVMCYIDLDRFKIVNDSCGHFVGDELLRQITALMQSKVRKTDILARLGGDEFGLLMPQCSLEQSMRVADSLRESIQSFHFVWQDRVFTIGASIGLVTISADSPDASSIMIAADAACYAAKDKGRNRLQVYQTDDRELVQQQHQMEWLTRINKALAENRFCLYYQPIKALSDVETQQHWEILLRMVDDNGQIILPMSFIPVAERYNLMPEIDRWVIRTLFAALSAQFQQTPAISEGARLPYLYTVNLSGTSINDECLIDFLKEQFATHKIPPQLICFEITETVAISNLHKAMHSIEELKRIGCYFALDDFGIGMSSFAYLKALPIDYLKIDGYFIQGILRDDFAAAIVEAINRIAQGNGIKTIAEFVADDAILAKVKALGIDFAQGYGIGKPRPFSTVPVLL
jgi:diguanylate cyclase (GGDEF)-like protein/PAS domain S-box-containing protein